MLEKGCLVEMSLLRKGWRGRGRGRGFGLFSMEYVIAYSILLILYYTLNDSIQTIYPRDITSQPRQRKEERKKERKKEREKKNCVLHGGKANCPLPGQPASKLL
jgi:hypothetical protein